jgi:hypothetical protein
MKLRKLRDSIASRVRELVVLIMVWLLVNAPHPLGSMSKESLKIVANWLVKLIGSTHGSTVVRAGIMSFGCGLKGNYGGVS